MNITELKLIEKVNYTLYVDLDGVLADLYSWVEEKTGQRLVGDDNKHDQKVWDQVKQLRKDGEEIFTQLKKMPDAMRLWGYIKKYKPHILTAAGKWALEENTREKKEWVKKNLTSYSNIYVTATGSEKAKYAKPNRILIDDRMKAIGPWRRAGGIGILHKSAEDTISQLKELEL